MPPFMAAQNNYKAKRLNNEKELGHMKKRVTLALALVAVISLSACDANGETTETTTEAVQEQTTVAEITETAAETEPVADTTASTIDEKDPELYASLNIMFRNGSWLFDTTASDGCYVYNLAEKNAFKLNSAITDSIYDLSGDLVYCSDEIIYNAVTGEKIFDKNVEGNYIFCPHSKDYFGTFVFIENTLFLGKKSSSFSEDGYELGCMNDKGEWIVPMTSDLEIFKTDMFNDFYNSPMSSTCMRYNDGTNNFYFDIINNQIFAANTCDDFLNFKRMPHSDDYNYCYLFKKGEGLVRYDTKNNCVTDTIPYTTIYPSDTVVCSNGFIMLEDDYNENKYMIIDPNTNESTTFDLSKYEYPKVHLGNTDFIFMTCEKDGTSYVGAFDANGDPIFEPVKGYGDCKASDKYVVSLNDTSFLYDIETNTVTTFNTDESSTDFYCICDFDVETNTLLIQAKNPDDGNIYYYLADANDPMNYYNPLEK